ncbi:hypothetical protein OG320_30055 [Microbispora sp. NBC_01189]|nr:hypothetical protein OG320_30055 [Microbispora sp. NBC_01189]
MTAEAEAAAGRLSLERVVPSLISPAPAAVLISFLPRIAGDA